MSSRWLSSLYEHQHCSGEDVTIYHEILCGWRIIGIGNNLVGYAHESLYHCSEVSELAGKMENGYL